MSDAEPVYSARIAHPQYIERGRQQTVRLPLYLGSELAPPSEGTYTLSSGSLVLYSNDFAVSDQQATATVPAAAVPASLVLGYGYREEWVCTMPGGEVRTFERDAVLVRRALYPVLTDADMLAVYSDLERLRPARYASFESYRIEAWKRILGRLESKGNLPNLIMTPWSLREVHLDLALYLVATDLRTGRDGKWADIADGHKREFEMGWGRLNFKYDETGQGDAAEERQPAEATLFTTSPPLTEWWW